MVFAGSVILPHGAIIFDGDVESESAECRQRYEAMDEEMKGKCSRVYKGCEDAAEALAAMKPDVVILHSPHGLILPQSVVIYGNERAQGTAMWKNHWSEFEVNVPLCKKTSQSLKQHFEYNGIPTEALVSFSDVHPIPLSWGEVVPLWFMMRALKENPDVKFVLITSPRPVKPLENLNEMHMKLGSSIAKFITAQKQRVAIAISGDLSHTHEFSSENEILTPLAKSKITENKAKAAELDEAMKQWVLASQDLTVKKPKSKTEITTEESKDNHEPAEGEPQVEKDGDTISSEEPPEKKSKVEEDTQVIKKWIAGKARPFLKNAAKANPQAPACGINGITILHSAMSLFFFNTPLIPRLYAYEAPTYYGMMAASFSPYDEKKAS